jgi:hypothetical protein
MTQITRRIDDTIATPSCGHHTNLEPDNGVLMRGTGYVFVPIW